LLRADMAAVAALVDQRAAEAHPDPVEAGDVTRR
jgi:hypothetical protein